MRVITVSPETNRAREEFFKVIFGSQTGTMCIAVAQNVGGKKNFRQEFFRYPEHMNVALEFINRTYQSYDVYFCPQLLSTGQRTKSQVKVCTCAWSDLDDCDPNLVTPAPTLVMQSSPDRYQGYWILKEPLDPMTGEDISHRIAHHYKSLGVDQSGWDLTQLLRVPLTYNFKYRSNIGAPVVELTKKAGPKYGIEEFEGLPQVPGYEFMDLEFPKDLQLDPDEILLQYRESLPPQVAILYSTTPAEKTWSQALWSLECTLFESGLTREETFVVCKSAACNKFDRDGLNEEYLWRDVCRAAASVESRLSELKPEEMPSLLTIEEVAIVNAMQPTFVEKFTEWAKTRGDASWQYFEAGGFVILSDLLSGVVKLPTSFGTVSLNLWFMILADMTLTRKSTAMDMAMEMLLEVDSNAVLATDGSLEGLLTGIATRPNMPGIFWRDEFSGLLEMIRRKDYYAGMIETLTKLYDGKYQKRVLRKEIIEIKDPLIIFFCGGIRTRILAQMDIEHIHSGFIPRFIFIEAESDIAQYKPMGPTTESQDDKRDELIRELMYIHTRFDNDITIHFEGQDLVRKAIYDAKLTPQAWDRYNQFEQLMVQSGVESNSPEIYTPVLDRLSKSTLKCAVLLAASMQDPQEKGHVEVGLNYILKAISYAERWREYNLDVVNNVGKTTNERLLDNIFKFIQKNPNCQRSRVMQNFHLTAREADWILETLEQRSLITRQKKGKHERLHPSYVS